MFRTIKLRDVAIKVKQDDGRRRLPGAPELPVKVIQPGTPVRLPTADANTLLRYLEGEICAGIYAGDEAPPQRVVKVVNDGVAGVDPHDPRYKWVDADGEEVKNVPFFHGEPAVVGLRQVPR